MTEQPQHDRCVLTRHDVQSIKDLIFILNDNAESSAQKAIFEIFANNMRSSRPAPSQKPTDATGFWFTQEEMKQQAATIRNQTIDEVIKHFEEVMMYHPLGVTISTLESLRTKEQP